MLGDEIKQRMKINRNKIEMRNILNNQNQKQLLHVPTNQIKKILPNYQQKYIY